jgi:hypothetical protein
MLGSGGGAHFLLAIPPDWHATKHSMAHQFGKQKEGSEQ